MTLGPSIGRSDTAAASPSPGLAGAQARRAQLGGAAGAGGAQGQQVAGRVISVGDGSITIEIRQPGGDTSRSVIALVGTATRLVKTVETDIKLADIKAGDQVLVVGQADPTGTVSANAVGVGVSALQQLCGGGGAPGTRQLPGARGASPSPSPR